MNLKWLESIRTRATSSYGYYKLHFNYIIAHSLLTTRVNYYHSITPLFSSIVHIINQLIIELPPQPGLLLIIIRKNYSYAIIWYSFAPVYNIFNFFLHKILQKAKNSGDILLTAAAFCDFIPTNQTIISMKTSTYSTRGNMDDGNCVSY